MIVGPTGTWTDDGRAVVKERLTSEPVSDAYTLPRPTATAATVGRTPSSASYDILVAFSDGRATWEDEPPAPAATHRTVTFSPSDKIVEECDAIEKEFGHLIPAPPKPTHPPQSGTMTKGG